MMSLFWVLCACIVGVAVLCLLVPLLRRTPPGTGVQPVSRTAVYRAQVDELGRDFDAGALDPAQRAQELDHLGRRLLDDAAHATAPQAASAAPPRATLLASVLLALLPSAAIVLYLQLGNPMVLWQDDDHADAPQHLASGAQVEAMVTQLAQRLRAQPDDAEGWELLARSYTVLERPADASAAYARAVALQPGDARLRADYADVLASADGGSLQGPARAQIEAALALDPRQPKALALAGSAALQRGDKLEAIARWEQLVAQLPPDSQTAQRIAADLALVRAEVRAGDAPATKAAAPAMATGPGSGATGPDRTAADTTAALSASQVAGRVTLGGVAGRKPGPDEVLFVYARPIDGSRMPLAVLRRKASDLPLDFTLDDSLAMRPDLRLSGHAQVMLQARISASGQAMPQPGDLVGSAGPVAVGSRQVQLVIDGEVPPDDRR